ncbi:cupin domain-containing protein [Streptomyces sp. NPDC047315]|uniref:cupin domain-containing protein n=1 Tax=Streptomyces sp. NPDC047315 TaxID=3155142 RepID=UPI0034024937
MIYGIANALDISLDYLFGVGEDGAVPARRQGEQLAGEADALPRFAMTAALGAAAAGPGAADAGTADVGRPGARPSGAASGADPADGPSVLPDEPVVQRRSRRRTIDLASGVRWERLTPQQDARVDFLEVVYQPFGRSTDTHASIRHDGREYQLVLHGTLHADIGFETYVLEAGDSLAFDSATPHQYRNMTDQEVRVISVVIHHTA